MTGPTRKRRPTVTEQHLEHRFTDYAQRRGCVAFKLVLERARGFPDRTVLCPGGRVVFFEFKRPDGAGVLSRQQKRILKVLRGLGFTAHVCDDFDDACSQLDDFLAAQLPETRHRIRP